jgi:hypothetical protein
MLTEFPAHGRYKSQPLKPIRTYCNNATGDLAKWLHFKPWSPTKSIPSLYNIQNASYAK